MASFRDRAAVPCRRPAAGNGRPPTGCWGLLLLCLAGCGCGGDAPAPGGPTRIKVSTAPFFTFAPFFIAQEEGYFQAEGLEVEFVEMNVAGEIAVALAHGDLDVGSYTPNPGIFNLVARGAHIRLVADRGSVGGGPPPAWAVLVRKALADEGALADPARLRRRRMVTTADNAFACLYERGLAKYGLAPADFDLRNVPVPARPDLLAAGGLDLVTAGEPWVTRLLDTGTVTMWIPDYEMAPGFQVSYVAYGPSLVSGNRAAGRAFMRAYLRAVGQYNQGKTDRNLEIIARHTNLEPAFLRRLGWPPIRTDGRLDLASLLEFQAWAKEKGLLDRVVAPEEFYDPSFIEAACEAIGAESEDSPRRHGEHRDGRGITTKTQRHKEDRKESQRVQD